MLEIIQASIFHVREQPVANMAKLTINLGFPILPRKTPTAEKVSTVLSGSRLQHEDNSSSLQVHGYKNAAGSEATTFAAVGFLHNHYGS